MVELYASFMQNTCTISDLFDQVPNTNMAMFGKMFSRCLSTSASRGAKVAVLGAAGGIGQPMSLLLKNVRTHFLLFPFKLMK